MSHAPSMVAGRPKASEQKYFSIAFSVIPRMCISCVSLATCEFWALGCKEQRNGCTSRACDQRTTNINVGPTRERVLSWGESDHTNPSKLTSIHNFITNRYLSMPPHSCRSQIIPMKGQVYRSIQINTNERTSIPVHACRTSQNKSIHTNNSYHLSVPPFTGCL